MKKSLKFPITGYMVVCPDNRIVKVRIDNTGRSQFYPCEITSLEPNFQFGLSGTNRICIPECTVALSLYPSRKKALKAETEKLHKAYREARKARREAEQKEKWANRRLFEYKNYERFLSFPTKA